MKRNASSGEGKTSELEEALDAEKLKEVAEEVESEEMSAPSDDGVPSEKGKKVLDIEKLKKIVKAVKESDEIAEAEARMSRDDFQLFMLQRAMMSESTSFSQAEEAPAINLEVEMAQAPKPKIQDEEQGEEFSYLHKTGDANYEGSTGMESAGDAQSPTYVAGESKLEESPTERGEVGLKSSEYGRDKGDDVKYERINPAERADREKIGRDPLARKEAKYKPMY